MFRENTNIHPITHETKATMPAKAKIMCRKVMKAKKAKAKANAVRHSCMRMYFKSPTALAFLHFRTHHHHPYYHCSILGVLTCIIGLS